MMMRGDGHAIAQSAEAQGRLEIRHAFVTVLWEVGIRTNGRSGFSATGSMLTDSLVRDLLSPIYNGGHFAAGGVLYEFHLLLN
jgi:hypothetical protein